eukprot:gnl/Spiro4/2588_TR1245_c0_g1_i1.p1 gnl/Spiro4/2588_TR1245_c0_g1~~gnl/Spiro4/2588_TR1245_c0_g1_i1.p1  ORF type:complete len:312 (-),score=39.30 gnl/Spiro4/2588_TR1245_c0_g1_i1:133-1068(-)
MLFVRRVPYMCMYWVLSSLFALFFCVGDFCRKWLTVLRVRLSPPNIPRYPHHTAFIFDCQEVSDLRLEHLMSVLEWCLDCGLPLVTVYDSGDHLVWMKPALEAALLDLCKKRSHEAFQSFELRFSATTSSGGGNRSPSSSSTGGDGGDTSGSARHVCFPPPLPPPLAPPPPSPPPVPDSDLPASRLATLNVLGRDSGRRDIVRAVQRLCENHNTACDDGTTASPPTTTADSLTTSASAQSPLQRLGELLDNGLPAPDLIFKFGKANCLSGFLPWHITVSEFFHVGRLRSFRRELFLSVLHKFAHTEQRYGK